jgi:hypothetical protein
MGTEVRQGTHFWFISILCPNAAGFYMNDFQGTWTPPAGATRLDMYNAVRKCIDEKDPRARGGIAVAFDIQRNELP